MKLDAFNLHLTLKYTKKREQTFTTFTAQRTDSDSFPKVLCRHHSIYGYII